MEFLGLFLSPHFGEKSLVAWQNDGVFSGYCRSMKGLVFKETVVLRRLGSQIRRFGFCN